MHWLTDTVQQAQGCLWHIQGSADAAPPTNAPVRPTATFPPDLTYLLRHTPQGRTAAAGAIATAAGWALVFRRHDGWCCCVQVVLLVQGCFLSCHQLLEHLQGDLATQAETDQQVRGLALQLLLYDVSDVSGCCSHVVWRMEAKACCTVPMAAQVQKQHTYIPVGLGSGLNCQLT